MHISASVVVAMPLGNAAFIPRVVVVLVHLPVCVGLYRHTVMAGIAPYCGSIAPDLAIVRDGSVLGLAESATGDAAGVLLPHGLPPK